MATSRLAVFDFDRTLAAAEVPAQLAAASRHASTRNVLVDQGFGGQQRVGMLADMLTQLTERHGVICAVCSLNSRDVIQQALTTVGLLRYFSKAGSAPRIRDRMIYMKEGHLKSRVIANTLCLPLSIDERDVLFIDDDPDQIKDCRLRLPRARTILVPRVAGGAGGKAAGGIGRDECDAILAWAANNSDGGGGGSGSGGGSGNHVGENAPRDVATLSAQQALAPPPKQELLGCSAFIPKQRAGPLAKRCATCGRHIDEHVVSAP